MSRSQSHVAGFPDHFPPLERKQQRTYNLNDCRLHRKPRRLHGFRLSTIRLAEEKPIVRSPRPQNFNQELLAISKAYTATIANAKKDKNSNEVQKRALKRRWISTTREATKDSVLPTPRFQVPQTTLEVHADPVRYRVKRTSPEPHVWQCYAREWDMMQLRCRMGPATKAGLNLPKISRNSSIIQCEVQPSANKPISIDKPMCNNTEQVNSYCHEELLFPRPMPGYGGFVPRNAVEPKPITDEDCITSSMCSTSRRTYRGFPAAEYGEMTFAHNGPLSKTVTLTYPFNPFNKIE